jgi:hypothetical protein
MKKEKKIINVDATFVNDDGIIMNAVYGSLLDEKNIPTSIFLFLSKSKKNFI